MVTDKNTYTERHRYMLKVTYEDLTALILKCHVINGWIRLAALEPSDPS